ncbi:hypothetical protein LF887_01440 [Chryseobacterium sp. MEBOG06]|uniref:FEKKY domain-containing protein n=1 Tax=Chryseobacterium sp. MEBOG06 TaxID=2879938 RepID=UPI001F1CE126|nr:hypothetical protein [Chryseobacterium sp. MEBOG06]UKB84345.1 hypothetical protein LF887_01440 [Chryseobacterium sp. MEBOG06]
MVLRRVLSLLLIIILLIISYFFNTYSANYPSKLRADLISFDFDMKIFLYCLIAIFLLSTFMAAIPFRNKRYGYKFFLVFISMNLVFIIINFIGSSKQYFEKKNEYEYLLVKTKQRAESDMKTDLIKCYYFGGDFIFDNLYRDHQKIGKEIDSLTKTYGVIYINKGGAIDDISIELNNRYEEYTESFLEKRNGKKWKYKMKKEIELLKNKYKK